MSIKQNIMLNIFIVLNLKNIKLNYLYKQICNKMQNILSFGYD